MTDPSAREIELKDIKVVEKYEEDDEPSPTVTLAEKPPPEIKPTSRYGNVSTHLSITLYMLSSSMMLIINKVTIVLFPFPTALLALQLIFSSGVVWGLGMIGFLPVGTLNSKDIKAYYRVAILFLLNIYTNMKALQHSNVETIIVFRTCTTVAVAAGDFFLLKNFNPSPSVLLSLSTIVGGAFLYVGLDDQLKIESIEWTSIYFFIQCCEVLYVKYVTSTVQMSNWTRSFYNNFLCLGPVIAMCYYTEAQQLATYVCDRHLSVLAGFFLLLSCAMGLMISWTGFWCRTEISATSFSVVGNMNKVLTVAVNLSIWDKHASTSGFIGLAVSLVGGALYGWATTR
eukprot:TRINITY_DN10648_c0_g1_i1.p1 TRINITY_DN10648_c0_g1~~TRINITY_DN10648_c0_g1_i1.p1  ORF type:complete len:342 (-),score=63.79 TRINITY_DN10648_c0_g1_i1:39-1064(-)